MKMKCKKNEKKKSCVKASVYRLEPNMLNSVTLVASLNGRVSFEESESSSTWHDDTSRLLRCKNWMPHVPFQQPSKRTTTYLKWRRASVTHVHKHGACVKAVYRHVQQPLTLECRLISTGAIEVICILMFKCSVYGGHVAWRCFFFLPYSEMRFNLIPWRHHNAPRKASKEIQ